MGDIRRLARRLAARALAALVLSIGLLLAVPAWAETTPGLWPPPLGPGAGSAETEVAVTGGGFAGCAVAHGAAELSENGNLSVAVSGNGGLSSDGTQPPAIVRLDENAEFSANLEIAGSASPPGDSPVQGQCADDAAQIVPPPPVMGPGISGGAPPDVPSASPGAAASAILPEQSVDVPGLRQNAGGAPGSDTALAASGSPDGAGAAAGQAPPGTRAPEAGPARAMSAGAQSSWGQLVVLLVLVGATLGVPPVVSSALQNRRGPRWVRAHVRAEPGASSAVGTELIPRLDERWPPTSIVRFALHADRGTQAVTEVTR